MRVVLTLGGRAPAKDTIRRFAVVSPVHKQPGPAECRITTKSCDPKTEQDILSLATSPVGTLCGRLRAAIDATPRHQFDP